MAFYLIIFFTTGSLLAQNTMNHSAMPFQNQRLNHMRQQQRGVFNAAQQYGPVQQMHPQNALGYKRPSPSMHQRHPIMTAPMQNYMQPMHTPPTQPMRPRGQMNSDPFAPDTIPQMPFQAPESSHLPTDMPFLHKEAALGRSWEANKRQKALKKVAQNIELIDKAPLFPEDAVPEKKENQGMFPIETMEPLTEMPAPVEKKAPSKRRTFVIEGVPEIALWEYRGCSDTQCVVRFNADEFPEFSFMGVKEKPHFAKVENEKGKKFWLFTINFSAPIKFSNFSQKKNKVMLEVKEKRTVYTPPKTHSNATESIAIHATTSNQSTVTLRLRPNKIIDVRPAEDEVLVVLPVGTDLAGHVSSITEHEAVRGCYVEIESSTQPILHIMLDRDVSFKKFWVEIEEESGMQLYKIMLKHKALKGALMNFSNIHSKPKKTLEPSDPFASSPRREGEQSKGELEEVTNLMSAGNQSDSCEVHIAQTSEDLRTKSMMAPEWLTNAQRAYEEVQAAATESVTEDA